MHIIFILKDLIHYVNSTSSLPEIIYGNVSVGRGIHMEKTDKLKSSNLFSRENVKNASMFLSMRALDSNIELTKNPHRHFKSTA